MSSNAPPAGPKRRRAWNPPRRYRLIQTRGRGRSWHVWGDDADARGEAEASFAENGVPVLVCVAPEGDTVRQLFTVGASSPSRGRAA